MKKTPKIEAVPEAAFLAISKPCLRLRPRNHKQLEQHSMELCSALIKATHPLANILKEFDLYLALEPLISQLILAVWAPLTTSQGIRIGVDVIHITADFCHDLADKRTDTEVGVHHRW